MPAALFPCFRLSPADFVALIDEREKRPLSLAPLRTEIARLLTGDYTIKGLERFVAVERKSRWDLIDCLFRRRCQLESQIQRLLAIPTRLLIIEATPLEIDQGEWPNRNLVTPQSVWETISHWEVRGLQVALTGTHERASRHVVNFLNKAANQYFDQFHPFIETVNESHGWHGIRYPEGHVSEPRVAGVELSQNNSIVRDDLPDNSPPVAIEQSLPLFHKRAA